MALCLGLGTLFITPSHAAADPASCTPSHNVSLFTYNDFHGRLRNASALFTPVERARSVQGEANVALISSGDDIGGSTFESMADNDNPTLKVMSAVGLNVQTVGNHEFDKGWADLAGRVNTSLNGIEQLGANVYAKGTRQVASPLKAYRTFKVGDLNVAVIGAVTGDLSSVVSPAGITGLTIGDPVEAVNETVAQLPPETDLVIASIHETWDRLESESNVSVMPQRHMMDAIVAATRHGAQVHMPPTDLGPYSLSEFSLRSLVRQAVDSVDSARGLRTSFQHAEAPSKPAEARELGVPETISCRISAHVTMQHLPELAQQVRDAVREACHENLGLSPTVNVHIEDLHDDD